jgi:hypothetical protein
VSKALTPPLHKKSEEKLIGMTTFSQGGSSIVSQRLQRLSIVDLTFEEHKNSHRATKLELATPTKINQKSQRSEEKVSDRQSSDPAQLYNFSEHTSSRRYQLTQMQPIKRGQKMRIKRLERESAATKLQAVMRGYLVAKWRK